jgi:hypothetical protein
MPDMSPPREFERIRRQLAEFDSAWVKQIQGVVKIQEMYGRQLNELVRALAPDLKAFNNLVAESFASIDLTWVDRALKQALPPNWRSLDSSAVDTILKVMDETGWCLVWCPRGEIIEELLAAPDVEARTRFVLDSKAVICDDLRDCLREADRSELDAHRHAAGRAIDAFVAGHFEAAQALAASDISALIGETLGLNFAAAREAFEGDPMQQSINRFRQQAAFNMVSRSLQRYFADRGDPVPTAFSRHATSHSISDDQYTEVNALSSLLLVVAFIRELDLLMREQDAEVP